MKIRSMFRSMLRSTNRRNASVSRASRANLLSGSDFFEGLEKRQLLATFNYNSGTGLLTVVTNQNSETLSIVSTSDAGNYTITTTGTWSGTSSVDVGNVSKNLFVNSTANINLIQISSNAANSGSVFYFGASTGNFVDDLTVNFSNTSSGAITVANATSFINGSNLNLTTAGNQITVSNLTSANSTGSISLTGRNIVVTGNITTEAGDISLTGNNGTYRTGTFDGVQISGAAVNVNTTGGDITIDGRGGLNTTRAGVNLTSSKVQAGGSGCLTITGMSGNGSTTNAYGILASAATVTSSSGSLTVNGTSCGTGTASKGVYLRTNATISATDAGNVTITGSTPGNLSTGVGITSFDAGSKVYANGGLITLTANSMNLTGTVNATLAGNVTIQPIGNGTLINLSNGTDTNTTLGLSAAEIGRITAGTLTIGSSTAGNITVSSPILWPTNLTVITGGKYFGVVANLTVGGTLTTPSLTPILVTNANNSGNGSLRTAITTASTNVGDDQISFASNLAGSTISLLTPLTINDLTGGSLSITGLGASNLSISGGGSTGLFSVYSPASFSGLTLTNGTGANGTSPNLQGGAIFSNSTLLLTSVTIHNSTANFGSAIYETGGLLTLKSSNIANSVYMTGSGNLTVFGGAIGSNVTVANGNTLSINDYTRSLDLFSFNWNSIVLSNITAPGNLTVVGNTSTSCISVTGPLSATGANSISLTGRNIVVTGNITTEEGDISLTGNNGSYQTGTFEGVQISGAAVNVNTTGGNITIDGRGGLNSNMAGVNLTSSKVQAGGSGCVTITGMSGNGSTNNAYGIFASAANVTTNSGSLTVNGTSCGTGLNSRGVYLKTNANISATDAGDVTITGTAANGTNGARGIYVATSKVTTNSGSLTVNGTSCGTGAGPQGVHVGNANISATGAGNVTITGTAGNGTSGGGGTGSLSGIYIEGARVTTSSGSLTVNGTSCGTGGSSKGVYLNAISNISATGAGNVTITGTAGNGTNTAFGIHVAYSRVTTNSGSLTINGTSCGTGTGSTGVLLTACAFAPTGSNISATGTGNVTITGSTPGNLSTGVGINSSYSPDKVSANGGLITLTANSMNLTGTVNATTAGNVLIQTFGSGVNLGNGTDTAANLGLSLTELNLITANFLTIGGSSTGIIAVTTAISRPVDGSLSLIASNSANNITVDFPLSTTGTGGISLTGNGIVLNNNISTAGGQITLTANSMNLTGTVNATSAGNVLIQTFGSGVNLGNGTDTAANMGLSQVKLNQITANLLTIGSSSTGNIAVTANISRPANGSLSLITSNTTKNIAVGFALSTTGTGGISLTGRNIIVTGNITTEAGDISLTGNNGSYQTGTFDGVRISGAAVNVNTTSGNITIDGRGGANTVNAGVNLTSSKVQAGGSGCLTITGVSGNGSTSFAYGILASGATVTTSSGSLTVNGTSCGTGTNSRGVYLQSSANISATGAGNVTITGTAAKGTSDARGIYVRSSNVTTSSGSLTVNGTSCGTTTASRGVYLYSSPNISATGAGNVTITGTAANGTDYARGALVASSTVTTSSGSLTVNGTSCGTGASSRGVYLTTFASISSTTTGNVTITGTAANGTDYARGVLVASSTVTTSSGSLTVNGTSCVTGTSSMGVLLNSSNISATGAGNVTITGSTPGNTSTGVGFNLNDAGSKVYANGGQIALTASSLNLTGTVNATSAGNVMIQTLGAGVILGGADSAANLGLTSAEINQITAATIQIGSTSTGNVTVSSNVTIPAGSNLTLVSNNAPSTGILSYGRLTMGAGKTLDISALPAVITQINGNTPQTQYSQLNVVGDLSIAGRSLNLSGSYTPVAGDVFVVASATSLTGTFTGQAEGSTITLNGQNLTVNYTATTVTLTASSSSSAPSITTQPSNQTATAGNTATFTAAASGSPTPTVKWQSSADGTNWTDIPLATSNSYITPTLVSGDSGKQYRAIYTNGVGTDATTNAATLTVNFAPSISSQPTNQTATAGNTAIFTAAATGNPTPTVQWEVSTDGTNWSSVTGGTGGTTGTYTTAILVAGDNGEQYRAVFSNGIGSAATTNAATLTVQYAPSVTSQPTSQTIGDGATATFTAAATGNPTPTVQWQVNTGSGWADVTDGTGGTTVSYTTAALSTSASGYQYRARFTNSVTANVATNAATVTVNAGATAPTVTGQPSTIGLEVGQTASFTASASGSPTPTVQWQVKIGAANWADIVGATSATYSFTTASADQGNQYQAVFSNTAGTATTNPATLNIGITPVFTSINYMTIPVGLTSGITVIATGVPAPEYTIISGSLPSGVTLDLETGLFAGAPAIGTAGSYPVTIQALNGIGTAPTQSFSLIVTTTITNFVVSRGIAQRSYIRYLDLGMDSNASALALLNNPSRVKLTKADLNGVGSAPVSLSGFLSVPTGQSTLAVDFGTIGLGNSRNTSTADGYYTLGVDLDGNGTFETKLFFFRLFGDTNGNREVNATDQSAVLAGCTAAYNANLDLNGDGVVNTSDLNYVKRNVGRKLKSSLIVTS